ncbi:DUF1896 family protein [Chryseobacterium sp.]
MDAKLVHPGLYFSKFDTIFQIVCKEFDTLKPQNIPSVICHISL